MILDTSFLIAIDADDEDAKRLSDRYRAEGVPQRIPTMVVLQLYVSVGAGDRPHENARKYEALVANQPIVPMDPNVARRAGALLGKHHTSDRVPSLDVGDAVIAATGLVYNEGVVTSDVDDFGSVDGLSVESW